MIYPDLHGTLYEDRSGLPPRFAATCATCGKHTVTASIRLHKAAAELRQAGWVDTNQGWKCPECMKVENDRKTYDENLPG